MWRHVLHARLISKIVELVSIPLNVSIGPFFLHVVIKNYDINIQKMYIYFMFTCINV